MFILIYSDIQSYFFNGFNFERTHNRIHHFIFEPCYCKDYDTVICCNDRLVWFQSWGSFLDHNKDRVSDFLEQVEKFIKSLMGARSNMEGHITLMDTEFGPMLDSMRSPSDYQAAGK